MLLSFHLVGALTPIMKHFSHFQVLFLVQSTAFAPEKFKFKFLFRHMIGLFQLKAVISNQDYKTTTTRTFANKHILFFDTALFNSL